MRVRYGARRAQCRRDRSAFEEGGALTTEFIMVEKDKAVALLSPESKKLKVRRK